MRIQKSNLDEMSTLFLVPTPIGNFEDMTYRSVETLKNVDIIYCEDTRVTKVLLSHFNISTPLKSYHIFNETERLEEILNNLKNEKCDIVEKIDSLDHNIDLHTSVYEEAYAEQNNIVVEEVQELTDLKNSYATTTLPQSKSLTELNATIAALNKQLIQMRSIKDVCPTCGQKLPDVHKPDTTSIENELKELQEDASDLEATLKDYETSYHNNVQLVKQKFADKKEIHNKNIQLATENLRLLKADKSKLQSDLTSITNRLTETELKLAQLQATIDNCENIIRNNNESISVTESEIMYNIKQRDLAQAHLEVVNKFDTALKRDFRGYLLSTVIEYIEQRAKYYSNIIFSCSYCLNISIPIYICTHSFKYFTHWNHCSVINNLWLNIKFYFCSIYVDGHIFLC